MCILNCGFRFAAIYKKQKNEDFKHFISYKYYRIGFLL